MENVSLHSVSGDVQGLATAAALLAALYSVCDDDLRRLRMAIHKAPSTALGFLDWLDHALGWEQDRRAGYAYPLRSPLAALRDDGLANSMDALHLLATTFRGDARISSLLDLVGRILPLHKPMQHHRPPHDEHQEAA